MNTTASHVPVTSEFEAIPDPWLSNDPVSTASPLSPVWQFPLDPSHELPGQAIPTTLIPAGPIGVPLLATSLPPITSVVAFLLQEELRLPDWTTSPVRDQIQAAIAWLGFTNQLLSAET